MIFLALLVSLITSAYLYVIREFGYWKKRGIVYIKPKPFVGNLLPIVLQKCSIGEYLYKIYKDYKNERFVGIFLADKPCLLVRDGDLAVRMLMQDFPHFNNRIVHMSKKTDPIAARSLFAVHGLEWKNTRAKVSPVFTSKKQKVVFDVMMNVGKKIINKLNEGSTVEIKELSAAIAVDMISDAVLGFDGKAISDPKNDTLRGLGNKLFDEGLNQSTRLNMLFLAPEIMELFRIRLFPESLYQTMRDATNLAFARKRQSGVKNGDYLDALSDLKEKGPWEGNNGEMIEPDDDNMVAQLFMFFTAGYETAASGVTYCIYELSIRQDIQDKLRTELNEALEKNDGQMSYEVLNGMKYLDNYVNEVLRKHPPFPFIDRVCSKDYTIPDTDITIERGTKLMIPMMGFHLDEKYFEDPETIIPERFDNVEDIKNKPYFPFGTGPRTCLGMRFAVQQMKIATISCVKEHRLIGTDTGSTHMRMSPNRFGNTPLTSISVRVQRL